MAGLSAFAELVEVAMGVDGVCVGVVVGLSGLIAGGTMAAELPEAGVGLGGGFIAGAAALTTSLSTEGEGTRVVPVEPWLGVRLLEVSGGFG